LFSAVGVMATSLSDSRRLRPGSIARAMPEAACRAWRLLTSSGSISAMK
jgi:hypothetical protein